jgi:hypothetical protein
MLVPRKRFRQSDRMCHLISTAASATICTAERLAGTGTVRAPWTPFPTAVALSADSAACTGLVYPVSGSPAQAAFWNARRADVVQVFPNPAALNGLAAAVLAELLDEWQAFGRRCLSEGSMA